MTVVPTVYCDFINGIYWVAPNYYTLAEVVTLSGSATIDGQGLYVQNGSDAVAELTFLAINNIAAICSKFLSNMTCVIVGQSDMSDGGSPLWMEGIFPVGPDYITAMELEYTGVDTIGWFQGHVYGCEITISDPSASVAQYTGCIYGAASPNSTFSMTSAGVSNTNGPGADNYGPYQPIFLGGPGGASPGLNWGHIEIAAFYPYDLYPGGPGPPPPPPAPPAPGTQSTPLPVPLPTPLPCIPCCSTAAPICDCSPRSQSATVHHPPTPADIIANGGTLAGNINVSYQTVPATSPSPPIYQPGLVPGQNPDQYSLTNVALQQLADQLGIPFDQLVSSLAPIGGGSPGPS